MKILMIVGQFPILSESFIVNQITGLIDRGHQVEICALGGYFNEGGKVHPQVQTYNLLEKTYFGPSLPKNYGIRWLKVLGLLLTNGYNNPSLLIQVLKSFEYGKKAWSLRLIYSLLAVKQLNNKNYDIIHCQFGVFGELIAPLKELGLINGKLITIFRGFDITEYPRLSGKSVYDFLFKTGDLFLANCDYFRQRAIELGCPEDKIFIIRSGIDIRKFQFIPRYFPQEGKVQIATVGRLVEKKGTEYVIKAIYQLKQTYPNIECSIIGDGWLRPKLEEMIKNLDLSDHVRILGKKQQQEIIEILSQVHLFVAPSVTAKQGDQDAPINTLKEAMAMGLPVISTYHGGIPELVEDGISGFLVPERDAKAIADKLHYLIEHPDLWISMGKQGRKFVENCYDMEKINDNLVQIYKKALHQGE